MDPDPDPDPAIFVIGLQDGNKKLIKKKKFCLLLCTILLDDKRILIHIGSRRPMNIRIRRIRIRNTAIHKPELSALDEL
jgi:hypothetical protein